MQQVRTLCQELPKLDSSRVAGSNTSNEKAKDPKLVGEVNEAPITINGSPAQALLDPCSVVSIILETF